MNTTFTNKLTAKNIKTIRAGMSAAVLAGDVNIDDLAKRIKSRTDLAEFAKTINSCKTEFKLSDLNTLKRIKEFTGNTVDPTTYMVTFAQISEVLEDRGVDFLD